MYPSVSKIFGAKVQTFFGTASEFLIFFKKVSSFKENVLHLQSRTNKFCKYL